MPLNSSRIGTFRRSRNLGCRAILRAKRTQPHLTVVCVHLTLCLWYFAAHQPTVPI
jgi:hypothetical protein